MKFSDMDEFLRDNPRWWENRKNNICTCEQQNYKDYQAKQELSKLLVDYDRNLLKRGQGNMSNWIKVDTHKPAEVYSHGRESQNVLVAYKDKHFNFWYYNIAFYVYGEKGKQKLA